MSCIVYTKSEYEQIFAKLKKCFAEASSVESRNFLYKIKCKSLNLNELFLYIWALNDYEYLSEKVEKENNFLTKEELSNILSRVNLICNC